MVILAVIVVVVSPLLPLNCIFGDDEDRLEDHLARLKDRLEYNFESGKPTEAYRFNDDSGGATAIAHQPEQQAESKEAESRGISRISEVMGTVANQCVRGSDGANTASARSAPDAVQYASSASSFEPEKVDIGFEVVDASQVECGHRANQFAAAG